LQGGDFEEAGKAYHVGKGGSIKKVFADFLERGEGGKQISLSDSLLGSP